MTVRYLPAAKGTEAGGDWYDVLELDDQHVAIVVGDVVGHGPAAAAVMGQLRSALAAYLLESHAPAHALLWLTRFAHRLEGAPASTAVCVVLNTQTGELRGESSTTASTGSPPRPPTPARLRHADRHRALPRPRRHRACRRHRPHRGPATTCATAPGPARHPRPAARRPTPGRGLGLGRGLPDDLPDDLQLLLGEAVANAVEHAHPVDHDGAELSYHVDHNGNEVRAEVGDHGTWRPPPADPGYRVVAWT